MPVVDRFRVTKSELDFFKRMPGMLVPATVLSHVSRLFNKAVTKVGPLMSGL